jgi:hypothetical protein
MEPRDDPEETGGEGAREGGARGRAVAAGVLSGGVACWAGIEGVKMGAKEVLPGS